MIGALTNAFEHDISNCLIETDNTVIEVYDRYDGIPTEKRCYIKSQTNQIVHFTLNNPIRANLVFAAIDNCILKTTDPSRCDFAIGNLQKLYFIEIKQVKTKQRNKAKSEAIDQLGSSISIFQNKIDLNGTELIAVVCVNIKQVHPVRTASSANKVVAFKENYNATLMEGQSDIF